MQGTERHLFPVVLREYHNPDHKDLHPRLIEFLSEYPSQQSNIPEGVYTSRPDLHKIEDGPAEELRQFFWDCLAEYRYNYKLYCDGFEISLMWSNHAPAGSGFGHPLHRHPMSYLSAVYYMTDGASTYFEDPCTPRTSDTLDVFMHDKMTSDWGINEKIDAEPGKLIIFPSWLKHYSGRQLDNFDRWTVSFNAFPIGKINMGPWDMPQLNVKVL
jgi:hypothetical protein